MKGYNSLVERIKEIQTDNNKESTLQFVHKEIFNSYETHIDKMSKSVLINNLIISTDDYAPFDYHFTNELDSTIETAELSTVLKGACDFGRPDEYGKKVISKLTDWEKIYFFAGLHAHQFTGKIYEYSTVPDLISLYIKEGINKISESHMTKFHSGEYDKGIVLPQAENYHVKGEKLTHEKQLLKELFSNLKSENSVNATNEIDEIEERISIMLAGMSLVDLKRLTSHFLNKGEAYRIGTFCVPPYEYIAKEDVKNKIKKKK